MTHSTNPLIIIIIIIIRSPTPDFTLGNDRYQHGASGVRDTEWCQVVAVLVDVSLDTLTILGVPSSLI